MKIEFDDGCFVQTPADLQNGSYTGIYRTYFCAHGNSVEFVAKERAVL